MNEISAAQAPASQDLVRILTQEEAAEEDRTYWHSKTPAQRLAAAEQLRQIAFGYDPITARIQATAELLQFESR
jgi:hypothetical protein